MVQIFLQCPGGLGAESRGRGLNKDEGVLTRRAQIATSHCHFWQRDDLRSSIRMASAEHMCFLFRPLRICPSKLVNHTLINFPATQVSLPLPSHQRSREPDPLKCSPYHCSHRPECDCCLHKPASHCQPLDPHNRSQGGKKDKLTSVLFPLQA